MRPPPSRPLASSWAPLPSSSFWPSTSKSPPRPAADDTSTTAPTSTMPAVPPSITTAPPRLDSPRENTAPRRFSTVPATWPRASATSSARPPSATTRPNWSNRAASAGRALNRIRPSPSRSSCTADTAARPTRLASMLPRLTTCGATSAMVPPFIPPFLPPLVPPVARRLPSLTTAAPASLGAACNHKRPACASASPRRSVVATRPPTSTWAPAPKITPRGLVKNTRPLASRRPRITDGSRPVTRLTSSDVGPSCTTRTDSPAPIEKLVQSIPAFAVVWSMRSVVPALPFGPAGRLTRVWPKVGVGFSGSDQAALLSSSSAASAVGRSVILDRGQAVVVMGSLAG